METSAIFQAGSLLVLVAEVRTRSYLASLVPIIVNTVLNEHQLVLDIVAFVALGDFPRSRLGEKQRGKILGNWISRSPKMRTLAQFTIRDPDAEGSVDTAVPERGLRRQGSSQSGRDGASSMLRVGHSSSLRHTESLTSMPVAEVEELEGDEWIQHSEIQHSELPTHRERSESRSDRTPTNERPELDANYERASTQQYFESPVELAPDSRYNDHRYHDDPSSPDSEDYSQYADGRRESGMTFPYHGVLDSYGGGIDATGGMRGLRVANQTSDEEADQWEQDALRSMNLSR